MEKCDDKNCPIHGKLRVQRSYMEGVVVSDKPKNTVIVERQYLQYVPKYERYERRKTKVNAHRPACMKVRTGDKVRIRKCRKISKTKTFVVTKVLGAKK